MAECLMMAMAEHVTMATVEHMVGAAAGRSGIQQVGGGAALSRQCRGKVWVPVIAWSDVLMR